MAHRPRISERLFSEAENFEGLTYFAFAKLGSYILLCPADFGEQLSAIEARAISLPTWLAFRYKEIKVHMDLLQCPSSSLK